MAKKILAIVLALGMLGYMAAPAMAASNVLIVNLHWVGNHQRARTADAETGFETVTATGGNVDVTNDDADATADGVDAVNTDVTNVGGVVTPSSDVAVINASGVGNTQVAANSTAYTGTDTVTATGGNVNLDNGTATARSTGWTLTNTSITRVR